MTTKGAKQRQRQVPLLRYGMEIQKGQIENAKSSRSFCERLLPICD
jgi:hypothetical protein